MGIPLPAATQWEIVEEAAEVIRPVRDGEFSGKVRETAGESW